MPRALVLGATGHIGAHVTRALLARGYQVRAGYRNPRYLLTLDGLSVERVRVDVDDPETLRRAADGCEFVFHCAGFYPRFTPPHGLAAMASEKNVPRGAGFSDPREASIARGLRHIRTVINTLKQIPSIRRIVYTSSAATIRPHSQRPSTEADQEPWPADHWRSVYATVKIAMEHDVLRAHREDLPVVITNPSLCLGEYDAHPFSGRLLLLYASGRCPFYLEHALNVVYTGDVGLGHVLAAERGQLGARYLFAPYNLELRELALRIAVEAGVAPPRWRVPYPLAMSAAILNETLARLTGREAALSRWTVRMARVPQRLDDTRSRQALGLTYTPLDECIRRALTWFRAHGFLRASA